MPLKSFRPITAAGRFTILNRSADVSKKRPERLLTESQSKSGGRNCYGRTTTRRRGGGHKRLFRVIDFKRAKLDIPATVQAIEYDPNRSANLALLAYADGEKRYILAPNGMTVGQKVISATVCADNEFHPGNSYPLSAIPPSTRLHAVEMPRRDRHHSAAPGKLPAPPVSGHKILHQMAIISSYTA
jgi:large subunit ribosomal protein L2